MNPKSTYRVFVAHPFDATMKEMYERILGKLKKQSGDRIDFIYGSNQGIELTPPLKRNLFKNQNNDLLKQFSENIESSDIIIADLTNT